MTLALSANYACLAENAGATYVKSLGDAPQVVAQGMVPGIGPSRGLAAPPADGAHVTPSGLSEPGSVVGPGAVVPPQNMGGQPANLGTQAGVNENPLSTAPSEAGMIPKNPRRATVALALGGGGARGAAHVGVLRVLQRAGIPVDYIAGSSMGSFVGGMYSAGVPLNNIEQMFLDKKQFWHALVPVNPYLRMLGMPIDWVASRFHKSPAGLFKTNKIPQFVASKLPSNRRNIENTQIKFAAVASNMLDGKTYPIVKGDLGKAVQASSAVPVVFRPVSTYEGKLLADGGVRANLPTFAAKQSTADVVIAVNVDENLRAVEPRSFRTLKGIINRTISMSLGEVDEHQLENADLVVRPVIENVDIFSTSPSDAARAIRAGEIAATQALPEIRKLLAEKFRERQQLASPARYVPDMKPSTHDLNGEPQEDVDVPTGQRPKDYGLTPKPTVGPNGTKITPSPANPDPTPGM
jgi:NTE family protein